MTLVTPPAPLLAPPRSPAVSPHESNDRQRTQLMLRCLVTLLSFDTPMATYVSYNFDIFSSSYIILLLIHWILPPVKIAINFMGTFFLSRSLVSCYTIFRHRSWVIHESQSQELVTMVSKFCIQTSQVREGKDLWWCSYGGVVVQEPRCWCPSKRGKWRRTVMNAAHPRVVYLRGQTLCDGGVVCGSSGSPKRWWQSFLILLWEWSKETKISRRRKGVTRCSAKKTL